MYSDYVICRWLLTWFEKIVQRDADNGEKIAQLLGKFSRKVVKQTVCHALSFFTRWILIDGLC